MPKEQTGQGVQVKLSFETVKKVLLGVFGVLIIANLITNTLIDDEIRYACHRNEKALCDCIGTGFKKLNIFTKVASMVDEDQFAAAKMMASTRRVAQMFDNM